MFKLIIEDDEGHTTVVPLQKEEITIGRKEGNTIRLTERNVSRHHARLIRTNGSVFIEDLDSYNGIKVNGDRIGARTNIRIGDLIEIGDYHLALQEAAQAEAPPPTPAASREDPPPLVRAQAQVGAPQPTVSDGGTAVLRLPVEDRVASDPGQVRPLDENQAGSLVVETTDLAGQVFALNRSEITLGRTEENDVVLPHRSVSSRHAKLVFDAGIYRVIDLDSANGVLVNGEEYARVDIRKGDVIELGHVKLRYYPPGTQPGQVSSPPPAAPQAAQSRRLVDASVREAELNKGGKGKLVGMLVGGVAVLALAGFLVMHFMGEKAGLGAEDPAKPGDGKGVVEDPGDGTKPAMGDDSNAVAAGGDVAKLPSIGDDEAKRGEAAALFKEGLKDMGQAKWDAAIEKLSIAVTMDPDNKGARSMLEQARKEKKLATSLAEAQTAAASKDWDLAMEKLQEIPEDSKLYSQRQRLYPEVKRNYRLYHINSANRLEKAGKIKDAIKHLDAVIMFDENNAQVTKQKEELLAKLNRGPSKPRTPKPPKLDAAAQEAKANEYRSQGMKAHKEQKLVTALKYYEKALKLNRRDYELYRLIGSAHAQAGNRPKAYSAYKSYVTKCPKCPFAAAVRGILKDYEAWAQ